MSGGSAQRVLYHTHFSVKIVDEGDEDGFRGCSHSRCAPFELPLVAEDDVLEAFGEVGFKFILESGFANEAVPEDDVALEDTLAGALRGEVLTVFDGFTYVVEECTGECEVTINLLV